MTATLIDHDTAAANVVAMLTAVAEVLERFPGGQHVRLLIVDDESTLHADEVLVQERVGGQLVLTPCKPSEVGDRVLHDVRVLDPADTALLQFAAGIVPPGCNSGTGSDGQTHHFYKNV